MRVKRLVRLGLNLACLTLLLSFSPISFGCCGCYGGGDNSCDRYSCGTSRCTNPTICDSSCPDKCDLLCDNNNVNYRGCGDNCIMP